MRQLQAFPVFILIAVFLTSLGFKDPGMDLETLERSDIHWIKVSKTSKAEILEKFGKPTVIDGNTTNVTWTYQGLKSELKVIMSVEDQIVQDFSYRKNSGKTTTIAYEEFEVAKVKLMDVEKLLATYGQPYEMEIGPHRERWRYKSPSMELNLILDQESQKVHDLQYRFMNR